MTTVALPIAFAMPRLPIAIVAPDDALSGDFAALLNGDDRVAEPAALPSAEPLAPESSNPLPAAYCPPEATVRLRASVAPLDPSPATLDHEIEATDDAEPRPLQELPERPAQPSPILIQTLSPAAVPVSVGPVGSHERIVATTANIAATQPPKRAVPLITELATSSAASLTSLPLVTPQPQIAVRESLAPAAPELHSIDLVRDIAWVETLAREIVDARSQTDRLEFALSPDNLGKISIGLRAGASGMIVDVRTETAEATRLIADAQTRLADTLRSEGVRVAETHVALANDERTPRRDQAPTAPFIESAQPDNDAQPDHDNDTTGRFA